MRLPLISGLPTFGTWMPDEFVSPILRHSRKTRDERANRRLHISPSANCSHRYWSLLANLSARSNTSESSWYWRSDDNTKVRRFWAAFTNWRETIRISAWSGALLSTASLQAMDSLTSRARRASSSRFWGTNVNSFCCCLSIIRRRLTLAFPDGVTPPVALLPLGRFPVWDWFCNAEVLIGGWFEENNGGM